MAIDEAAAIPLPTVKKLLGPYLVFMSSTGRWERERERDCKVAFKGDSREK